MIIFFDNVDSISDLEQNRLFIAALQQFIIDCSFFFVINLDNKNLFAGAEISGFIHDAKFVCFLTTRIVTIQRFLALAPNLEQVYGWTSLQMPVGFYNHMDILRRRMTYLQKAEARQASKSMETLNSILDFAESAYKTNSFRKLFNGNFRFCLDALCTMVQHYSPTGLISECNRLYESGSNIEGASGMVLSMLCNYLKDQRIYEEKFHLSDCAPDGKLSLSRIILTIIRENGGRCSFLALLELLSPLFEIKEICDVAYDLMEAKRNVLRRMVAFDIVFPRSSQEVIAQGEAFLKGDREESHYSELSLCVSGRAYLDYMVPHFEFMLSRHRMEYDYITNPNYHPLFSRISERRIGPEDAEQVFIFERKIDWVFADVRDCCQNSVGFSTRLMEHFHWDRDTYINNSYFNYHMINRDGSPGYRQSYESRLIFSHIGYIERYRRYLLQKYKTEAELFLQDINARLILRLRRYVELYQDEELCFHTPPQDTVADYLMRQIESIENAGYLDFRTKVEYNPLSA